MTEDKELPVDPEIKVAPPMAASIIFRNTSTGAIEKVFVDHMADPQRAYPTGEFYELLGKASEVKGDATAICAVETVTIMNPEDFDFYVYKRISDIPEGCIVQEKKCPPE